MTKEKGCDLHLCGGVNPKCAQNLLLAVLKTLTERSQGMKAAVCVTAVPYTASGLHGWYSLVHGRNADKGSRHTSCVSLVDAVAPMPVLWFVLAVLCGHGWR